MHGRSYVSIYFNLTYLTYLHKTSNDNQGSGSYDRFLIYNLPRLGNKNMPIPVTERSKANVYGRSLAGIAGSNPACGMDVSLF